MITERKLICPNKCLKENSMFTYYDIDKSTKGNLYFICPVCKTKLIEV